jgi:hypothetical protein
VSDKEWGSVGIVETPDPKINALITFADFIFDSRMGEIRYIALLVAERVSICSICVGYVL